MEKSHANLWKAEIETDQFQVNEYSKTRKIKFD